MLDTNLVEVAQAAAATAAQATQQASLNTVVVAAFGLLGLIVTTFGTLMLARINANSKNTKEVAEKSLHQSEENGKKVDNLHETTHQIHGMVNKPFGVALEAAARAMEVVAGLEGATSDHKQAATVARQTSNQHHGQMVAYEMAQRIQSALNNKSQPAIPVVEETTREVRVLLIEDDPGMSKFMQEIIARPGIRFHSVKNGETGIAMLAHQPYDLLFVDMRLPGQLQGWDIIPLVSQLYPDIFIVACYTEDDDIKKISNTETIGYMKKPFREESINRWIKSRQVLLGTSRLDAIKQ